VLVRCLLCVEYWLPLACGADILVIVLLVGLLLSVGCLSLLVSTFAVLSVYIINDTHNRMQNIKMFKYYNVGSNVKI
jgi:hypothetical protein